ncbi:MAG: riboflavin kinase / adenylyltransferase [Chthoniobacter sp.]|jgi:riboflavin kinase/FMN adenylyltransferase|nr:riboflavin kinase / adenylyltransferase [Chthoniobacter sp.]
MTHACHSIAELGQIPGPLFLAIGVFDGVHLGHRAVLDRALADARQAGGTAVAVTFDPHPARLLRPEQAPRLLTSTQHKIRLIRALGIPNLLVNRFDRAFAATPPEEFIRSLAAAARPLREICVGFEWSFGKDRGGNLALLDRMGRELGFQEVGVPAVEIDGRVVSSTLIRSAVEAGDLATAARFLGREYTILGTVTKGAQLGRTLGFPTANLSAHNEQFPPNGVYAVEVARRAQTLRGVANIGVRPTLAKASGERVFEVHLFDFSEDLYGEDLEVTFRGFLRPEQKFASLDALRAQIAHDAQRAREHFAG